MKMNKSITFKTAFNPHYREEQKICGTLSLERSFADFLFKKILSQIMSASFKGFYKAAKFYSQKPQVCSLIAEADKNVVFPIVALHLPWSIDAPSLHRAIVSMTAGTLFHGNQRKTNQ